MNKVRYYSSFSDDFEESANQNYKLPDDYEWVRTDILSRFLSGLIYGLAIIFGGAYCKLILHLKVRGRRNLKGMRGDFFLYGNHTQPVGDVFIPALCVLPKRIFTLVSPANYGIPVIGKILPYLGALPVTSSLHGIKELSKAIEQRLAKHHPIVIYPEAHIWEYYTEIRPYPESSFKFPAKLNKPAFAMTATYRKGKISTRPIMEVYLDGPFYAEGNTIKEMAADLHQKVYQSMLKRSKQSDYRYIEYRKK